MQARPDRRHVPDGTCRVNVGRSESPRGPSDDPRFRLTYAVIFPEGKPPRLRGYGTVQHSDMDVRLEGQLYLPPSGTRDWMDGGTCVFVPTERWWPVPTLVSVLASVEQGPRRLAGCRMYNQSLGHVLEGRMHWRPRTTENTTHLPLSFQRVCAPVCFWGSTREAGRRRKKKQMAGTAYGRLGR